MVTADIYVHINIRTLHDPPAQEGAMRDKLNFCHRFGAVILLDEDLLLGPTDKLWNDIEHRFENLKREFVVSIKCERERLLKLGREER